MLSVIMLSVIMLGVIMLNVVLMSVMLPTGQLILKMSTQNKQSFFLKKRVSVKSDSENKQISFKNLS